ncbi:metal-dependent hydrolase, partial [Thermovibrio ammonificans]
MRWPAHVGIAWGLTAPFCPSLAVLAGATAPDWLEFILEASGRRVEHRWETHFLAVWGLAVLFFGFLLSAVHFLVFHLFWFAVGGFLHVVCDALTVSGVPLWWGSRHRYTILGGKLRTGEPTEFVLALAVLAISFFLGWCRVGVGGGCLFVRA